MFLPMKVRKKPVKVGNKTIDQRFGENLKKWGFFAANLLLFCVFQLFCIKPPNAPQTLVEIYNTSLWPFLKFRSSNVIKKIIKSYVKQLPIISVQYCQFQDENL